METIDVNSRMPHFRLISKVAAVSTTHLDAEATLIDAPCYVGLEIMAQTAALHVRRMLDFERHAFLLSVQQFTLPKIVSIKGCFRIKAVLRNQSSDAFGYNVMANGPGGIEFGSDVLIGTTPYDDRFTKDALTEHYQQLWSKLKED